MATAIQFLRSSTPRLRPNPADLASGMPMVNIAPEEPGLYFKTSDSKLFKVGPTFIGTVPPNDGATGFAGNTIGEQWLDVTAPDSPILKIWDGLVWKEVAGGSVEVETQANWNETDVNDPGFIQNKPTVLSEFTNDVGYLTSETQSNWTETDNTDAAFIQNKPTKTSDFTNDGSSAAAAGTTYLEDGDGLQRLDNTTTQFITSAEAPVQSVNTQTGAVSLALDNISDVAVSGAVTNNVLVYNGTSWEPGAGVTSPPSVQLKGTFDVSDINTLPGSAVVGDTYIQKSPTPGQAVTANAAWPDIANSSVDDGAFVYYVDVAGSGTWTIGNNNIASFQSDWAESNSASNSFIQNKPTIGDGELKILASDGTTEVGTFKANQTTDLEITLPAGMIEPTANGSHLRKKDGTTYTWEAFDPSSIADTLQGVTDNGNTTTNGITALALVSSEISNAAGGAYGNGVTPAGNVMPLDLRKLPPLPVVRSSSTLTYGVTVNNPGSGNKYYLNGSEAPSLTGVYTVDTLIFDYSDDSNIGHVFKIFSDAALTTEVVIGVTIDAGNETLTFEPDAAGTYYYDCETHPGMGSTIVVVD